MKYDFGEGAMHSSGYFTHFCGFSASETGGCGPVRIDLQFRMTTNGIIVNTIVNSEPLITTSAGLFYEHPKVL